MNVRELQDVLLKLEGVYASAGATKQAGSIAMLAKTIGGRPELSVDELISEIRLKLSVGGPVGTLVSKEPALNAAIVADYSERLVLAGTDRTQFDHAFTALKNDINVKSNECFAIANRYKNQPINGSFLFTFSSKREALEFIFDTYIGRAQAESKAGIIDRITNWATR